MSIGPASAPRQIRSTERVIIGLLSALAVFWVLAGISRAWVPPGDFGLALHGNLVVAVEPGSPASEAGIQPGDRVDEGAVPPYNRSLTGPVEVAPGTRETIRVIHASTSRVVTLVAAPGRLTQDDRVFIALDGVLLGLLLVALGASLALVQPNRMTWAFFIFCAGLAHEGDAAPYWLPPSLGYWNNVLYFTLNAAGWVAFLVFAIRFPFNRAVGRWQIVDRAAPGLFAVMAALYALELLPGDTWGFTLATVYFGYALAATAVVALLATYIRGQGDERQRVKWVLTGLSIGIASRLAGNAIVIWWPNYIPDLYWVSFGQLAIPLSVVYAVIRYRVLDVVFVINRTLIYGVLASLIVAIFALVDWFFVKKLVSTRAGLAAEIFVALAIGFWLNTLHERVNWFIDRTFFRRRYLAEQRLRRTALALPHAASIEMLNGLLVEEPLEALDLGSAAVFQKTTEGTFARTHSVGWSDGSTHELTRHDRLLVHLEAEPVPLRTREIHWTRSDLPPGSAHPTLALPILLRRQLAAIALYGEPKSGAELDPEEVRAIGALAGAAGAAYDHLEADALRKRVAQLESDLARTT